MLLINRPQLPLSSPSYHQQSHIFLLSLPILFFSPPFGLPSYTFCHPFTEIPPSSIRPSHPIQPSTLPKKPSVPTPPLLPDISLSKLDTKPISHLNTSLPLSDHGGRKVSFHINAKFFSFSFNGGWPDLYAIHESSWHVKHII